MSDGSTTDGDDIVAGRTNRVQSATELLLNHIPIADGNKFIFRVRSENADPTFTAIEAVGGGFGVNAAAAKGIGGGTGLTACGHNGVEGHAESSFAGTNPAEPVPGGIGVLGVGHVGVEGHGDKSALGPTPEKNIIGGIGIFGTGQTAIKGEGVSIGIFGTGHTAIKGEGVSIGVSGSLDGSSGGIAGLLGSGPIGVLGQGGPGPGGSFSSSGSAQIHLEPQSLPTALPSPVATTATAIAVDKPGQGPALPKNGVPGDIMAVVDTAKQCTLWFCVRGDGSAAASWVQVLLGKPFEGTI